MSGKWGGEGSEHEEQMDGERGVSPSWVGGPQQPVANQEHGTTTRYICHRESCACNACCDSAQMSSISSIQPRSGFFTYIEMTIVIVISPQFNLLMHSDIFFCTKIPMMMHYCRSEQGRLNWVLHLLSFRVMLCPLSWNANSQKFAALYLGVGD